VLPEIPELKMGSLRGDFFLKLGDKLILDMV
jgi:hypothetical protein